jgi:phage tail P2-like protein
MIDLRSASLVDFLPDSIASDQEILALSLALDPELQSVAGAIVEAIILPRIATIDEKVLDELGWAMRLNELQLWESATVDGKRSLLANIFAIRKKAGTRYAVRRIFDLISVTGTIIEWWEEGREPFTYRLIITITDVGITFAQLTQIPELLQRFAPTRAYLAELALTGEESGSLFIYPATTAGMYTTVPFGGP